MPGIASIRQTFALEGISESLGIRAAAVEPPPTVPPISIFD
ncbi:hypothetical protein [Rhizobium leguminosarum]|nr:hypothetical protein [Rhizobium leguminosarum]